MNTWRYFKIGDIVTDPEVWGRTTFVIRSFHGNDYCPLIAAESLKPIRGKRIRVNLGVPETRLVNAPKRPLMKIADDTLRRLVRKSTEARRELLIRTYRKQNGDI
nr:MAG TPA: hypothetical protein [Caudoviricetes sp.]